MSEDSSQHMQDGSQYTQDGSQCDGDEQCNSLPRGEPKQVQFNVNGQPIGQGSAHFATLIGKVTKTHCSPTYTDWSGVPDDPVKNNIWKSVLVVYDLEPKRRSIVMQKANTPWKNWKYVLRQVYDSHLTNAERMKHIPKKVKKEDWETFIKMCSTNDDNLRRQKGKASRRHMTLPHMTGRRGCARLREELEKESMDGKVTRTQMFVAAHTKTDGTCPSLEARPTLDEIKGLISLDPYLGERDLDHYPVAIVCGVDGKGRVRGKGGGVSKTVLHASTPFKDFAHQEKRALENSEANFRIIMQPLDEESRGRKILEEQMASLLRNSSRGVNDS